MRPRLTVAAAKTVSRLRGVTGTILPKKGMDAVETLPLQLVPLLSDVLMD